MQDKISASKLLLTPESFQRTCLICFSDGHLYDIKKSMYEHHTIAEIFSSLISGKELNILEDCSNFVGFHFICFSCIKHLIATKLFIEQCRIANKTLSKVYDDFKRHQQKSVTISKPIHSYQKLNKIVMQRCNLKNIEENVESHFNNGENQSEELIEIMTYKSNDKLQKRKCDDHIKIEGSCQQLDISNIELVTSNVESEIVDIKNDKSGNKDEIIFIKSNFVDDNESENAMENSENYKSAKKIRVKNRKKYHCDECCMDFIGYRLFSQHNKDKHIKWYICNVCKRKFVKARQLVAHRWTHLQMECNICHKKVKKSSYKSHIKTHDENYKPKRWNRGVKLCPLCGKVITGSGYIQHMAIHTAPKKYKCKLCSFASSFSANLRRHQALHTGAKPYLCTNCGYSCNQKTILEGHAKQHVVSATPLKCPFCSETFRTRYDRRLHSIRHGNGNTAAGNRPKSGNSGVDKTAYLAFDKKYYNADQGKYVCPSCTVMCQSRDGLVRHLRNEHGDFDAGCLPCGYCDKKFSSQGCLGLHIRTQHHTATPYICNICNKALTTGPSLKEHIFIHTGEKPHKCNLCPSTFRQQQHLTTHKQRMHDDRKPYCCEFCDKAFKCTFSLKEHVRLHTGETIKCEHCEKSFKQSSNKYKHMREVHNIRRSAPKAN